MSEFLHHNVRHSAVAWVLYFYVIKNIPKNFGTVTVKNILKTNTQRLIFNISMTFSSERSICCTIYLSTYIKIMCCWLQLFIEVENFRPNKENCYVGYKLVSRWTNINESTIIKFGTLKYDIDLDSYKQGCFSLDSIYPNKLLSIIMMDSF